MKFKTKIKGMIYSAGLVAMTPLMVGCDPFTTGAALGGSILWWDIFLIPVRSLLGSAALGIVNTI